MKIVISLDTLVDSQHIDLDINAWYCRNELRGSEIKYNHCEDRKRKRNESKCDEKIALREIP